ncbi:hypothetical protein [Paenibacillus polymyxa]|uniref:hypothetical protein n=1 Tax=Paenibacillus polymyxa TaxID=1406 RepID=UPI0004705955|nr:hypothetical protein [Paenibacillus polymyxa]
MDLNNMVNQALTNIHSEGLVEKIVRNKLEKTIESIIDDIFSSYGDFGKQLKEHVKQHFSINLGVLDLPSYNTLIAQVIKEKLDEITHIQGVEKLKEQMDRMLVDVKPEYKLSELINGWKKSENEDDEYDDSDEFSLHIDKDYSTWIHLDPEPDKGKYQCKYGMLIRDDGTLFCLKIDDREIKSKDMMYGLHGIAEDLFKIYAHGSKLVIDEDEINLYYENSEY